jgi:hypothetical protein
LFYIWYFLSASGDFWYLAVHQSLAKFQQQILVVILISFHQDPDFILIDPDVVLMASCNNFHTGSEQEGFSRKGSFLIKSKRRQTCRPVTPSTHG